MIKVNSKIVLGVSGLSVSFEPVHRIGEFRSRKKRSFTLTPMCGVSNSTSIFLFYWVSGVSRLASEY